MRQTEVSQFLQFCLELQTIVVSPKCISIPNFYALRGIEFEGTIYLSMSAFEAVLFCPEMLLDCV